MSSCLCWPIATVEQSHLFLFLHQRLITFLNFYSHFFLIRRKIEWIIMQSARESRLKAENKPNCDDLIFCVSSSS